MTDNLFVNKLYKSARNALTMQGVAVTLKEVLLCRGVVELSLEITLVSTFPIVCSVPFLDVFLVFVCLFVYLHGVLFSGR